MPGTQSGDGDGGLERDAERETERDAEREADAVTLKPRVGDRVGDGTRDCDTLAEGDRETVKAVVALPLTVREADTDCDTRDSLRVRDGEPDTRVTDTEAERERDGESDDDAVGDVVCVPPSAGSSASTSRRSAWRDHPRIAREVEKKKGGNREDQKHLRGTTHRLKEQREHGGRRQEIRRRSIAHFFTNACVGRRPPARPVQQREYSLCDVCSAAYSCGPARFR